MKKFLQQKEKFRITKILLFFVVIVIFSFLSPERILAATTTVTSVSSTVSNGYYKAGAIIPITVTFSLPVTVTGTPALVLETGTTNRSATYVSGDGTNILTLNYTVVAGDTAADLNYYLTSSLTGTIKNGTTSATLTLPTLTGVNSLAGQKAIVIDTTAPTLSFTDDVEAGPVMTDTVVGSWGDATIKKWDYFSSSCPFFTEDYSNLSTVSMNQTTVDHGGYICLYGEDTAGNSAVKSSAYPINLDRIAPIVSSVAVQTATTINITFNEAMGTGMTTASNYTVSGTGKGTLSTSPSSVSTVSGSTYRLTFTGEMLTGGDITITVNSTNVKDVAGNAMGYTNSGTHVAGGMGTPPVITIANPTTTAATSKVITATFTGSVSNYMVNTTGTTCNGTLTFVAYASQTFSNESDNGKYVCYKSVDAVGNIAYKLSDPIAGIDKTGPTVVSVFVQTADTISVIFSEAVNSAALTKTNYIVSGDGKGTLASSPYFAPYLQSGNTAILEWASGEMVDGKDITITVNATNVKDVAGNSMGSPNSATHVAGGIGVPPYIVVANPTTTPATSKVITATFTGSVSNYMVTTTNPVCDGSLTFVAYASQTFSNESDNGKYVCYKSVDVLGNIAYQRSNAIAGIDKTGATINISITPSTTWATNRTITATATDASATTITMKETTGTTCDGTLTLFITYASKTYSTQPAAGTKICYKAVDAVGNITYKLSDAIVNIDNAGPVGSSLSHASGITTNTSVLLTASTGTDALSGINYNSNKFLRSSATYDPITSCGSFNSYIEIYSGSSTSYTDSGLTKGFCYMYSYQILDNAGNGATKVSSSMVVIVGSPNAVSLTATPNSNSEINLSWTTPNNGGSSITGYLIERCEPTLDDPNCTDEASWTTVTTAGSSVLSYKDQAILPLALALTNNATSTWLCKGTGCDATDDTCVATRSGNVALCMEFGSSFERPPQDDSACAQGTYVADTTPGRNNGTTTKWTWKCQGDVGTLPVDCESALSGICGIASLYSSVYAWTGSSSTITNSYVTTAPNYQELCYSGIPAPTSVTLPAAEYSSGGPWSCLGVGTDPYSETNCYASRGPQPTPGSCVTLGSSNVHPNWGDWLCSYGTYVADSTVGANNGTTTKWTWKCQGDVGSSPVSCESPLSGTCGYATTPPRSYPYNGLTTTLPEAGTTLCLTGIANPTAPVLGAAGNSTIPWVCNGVGTSPASANCSAKRDYPAVSASCAGSPATVAALAPVTWTATPGGGNNSYTYIWSGTDSLSGTSNPISKTYSTSGQKNATIRVTSLGLYDEKTCQIAVDPIQGACGTAINSSWTAFPSPASTLCAPGSTALAIVYDTTHNNGTNVAWTWQCQRDTTVNCTAPLSGACGNAINLTYLYTGSQTIISAYSDLCAHGISPASVTLPALAGSVSPTWTCAGVGVGATSINTCQTQRGYPDVTGSCNAVPPSGVTPLSGNWTAVPGGGLGLGTYTYTWSQAASGGTTITVPFTYATDGTRTAGIIVHSGGLDSTLNTCSVVVSSTPIAGECGTYGKVEGVNYASNVSAWPAIGTFCGAGNGIATPTSPVFPLAGATREWTCGGLNLGASSGTCKATKLSPPTVTVKAPKQSYCEDPITKIPTQATTNVYLEWTYGMGSAAQQSSTVEIYSNSGYTNRVWFDDVSGSTNAKLINVKVGALSANYELNFSTQYYWQVKVFDQASGSSAWVKGTPFATPSHAYPYIKVTHTPASPIIKYPFYLNASKSACYGPTGVCTYNWTLDDNTAVTGSNPAGITRDTPKTYVEQLRVTDDDGHYCETDYNVPVSVSKNVPEWKEISPF